MKNKITIICGATASGKSAIALKMAKEKNGVIINADSMQLYKDLRIITARPSIEEEAEVPHHLYGILEADEISSAGKWVLEAKKIIDKAQSEGKLPIVVGGTGFYIKTLMKGISPIPDVSNHTKTKVRELFNALNDDTPTSILPPKGGGREEESSKSEDTVSFPPPLGGRDRVGVNTEIYHKFREELAKVDEISASKIKLNDKQRLMRAMEVYLETGKPLSYWQKIEPEKFYDENQFDLQIIDIDRAELYRRCDERFLKMLDKGGLDEVEKLREKLLMWSRGKALSLPLGRHGGLSLQKEIPIMRALGVKELFGYLDGEISLDEAVAKAQQSTRNYAKRQCTWFKNQLFKC